MLRKWKKCYLVTTVTCEEQSALNVKSCGFSRKWCLDSGCTLHMCHDADLFQFMEEPKQRSLNLASSTSVEIETKGTVLLLVSNGHEEKILNLKDALYVPDLRTVLISVAKITDRHCTVTFRKTAAEIRDEHGDVKVVADRIDDLCYVREIWLKTGSKEDSPSHTPLNKTVWRREKIEPWWKWGDV